MLFQIKKGAAIGLVVASYSGFVFSSGFDRGVVPPDFLFEKGDFVQFSFASVEPTVKGKVKSSPKGDLEQQANVLQSQAAALQSQADLLPDGAQKDALLAGVAQAAAGAAQASAAANLLPAEGENAGSVAKDYTRVGFSLKKDVNDDWTVGLNFTQPGGIDVEYSDALFSSGIDDLKVSAFDALVKYKFNENFSVFAGPRLQEASDTSLGNSINGRFELDSDQDLGYNFGIGYHNTDYQTRVLFSYTSKIEHTLSGQAVAGSGVVADQVIAAGLLTEMYVNTPQQIQVSVKQPLSERSMLLLSYRHAKWSDANIASSIPGFETLTDYDDVNAYVLGYGYKVNDDLSLLGSYTHQTGKANLYLPVNDRQGLALLARYKVNNFRFDGGIIYYKLEDAENTIPSPAGDITMEFEDNDAIAYTARFGYFF